jgi:hypothetical protein
LEKTSAMAMKRKLERTISYARPKCIIGKAALG